jgi:hypothetical protein
VLVAAETGLAELAGGCGQLPVNPRGGRAGQASGVVTEVSPIRFFARSWEGSTDLS